MRSDSFVLFLSCVGRLLIQSSSLLHKAYLLLVAALPLCVAAASAAETDIQLVRAIAGPTDTEKFGEISGVHIDNQGVHVLATGGMTSFSAQGTIKRAVAGKQKLFSARKFGGVAALGQGQWAIAQSSDQRIVVIDDSGATRYVIAEGGSHAGQLDRPLGLAYSARSRLYICDSGNNRVSVFSRDGVYLFSLGVATGPERLESPTDIALDDAERIYVFDAAGQGRVSVFGHDGKLLKQVSAKAIDTPEGPAKFSAMTAGPDGLIYLADAGNGKIVQFDWQTGKVLRTFGSKGSGRGQFARVTAMSIDPGRKLVVGDSGNHKVEVYQLSGAATRPAPDDVRLPAVRLGPAFAADCDAAAALPDGHVLCLNRSAPSVTRVAQDGKATPAFSATYKNPRALALDARDVAIIDDDRIRLYGHDGTPRFVLGRSGSGDGEFDDPSGVFLKERIFVADTGNQRIQMFTRDGVFLDKLGNTKNSAEVLRKPVAVVVDTQGNIYVADNGYNKVRVFSANKERLFDIDVSDTPSDGFQKIHDLAMDQDDNLYVLAATATNTYAVYIYSGPTRVFAFGSAGERGAGMVRASTLSLTGAQKTTLAIYDAGRKRLQTYYYEQVPSRVGGLLVRGGRQQSLLRWQKTPGTFVTKYRVYAAASADQDYQKISETDGNSVTLTRTPGLNYLYYRVSAVSAFDRDGPPSQPAQDVFSAAYARYQEKNMAAAAILFAAAVKEDETNSDALEYLGRSLLEQANYDAALRAFGDLGRHRGYEATAANLRAETLVRSNQLLLARATLDQAITARTVDARTYLMCGQVTAQLGDNVAAANCLENALRLDPDSTDAHFELGQVYVKLGAVNKGLAEFDTAVDMAPQVAEIWQRAGAAYQALARHDEALVRFNKALSIDAQHAAARIGAARSHIALKEYDQGRAIALSLSGTPSQEAAGEYLLGMIALAGNQPQEAILALAKAGNKNPTHLDTWLALADAHGQLGHQAQVKDALQRALAADPAAFEAHNRLGQLELESNNRTQAAEHLARAVALQPANYDARYRYASTLLALDHLKDAGEQAKEAMRLEPKRIEPIMLLADSAHRQGKNGEAIALLSKALALNDASAPLHLQLGTLYLENNVYDAALRHLERAASLDMHNPLPHVLLGRMYLERRLFDSAIKVLTRAVELSATPENKARLDAAYAEKKRSLEFDRATPRIVLQDLRLERVFSAAYKRYATQPVGRVVLKNTSGVDYPKLTLSFYIKGYMDFPSTQEIPLLKANAALEVPLYASFNNRILGIDEDTGVQAEVKLAYAQDGQQNFAELARPMTIYSKNAILWADAAMVGSFVTPKDDVLKNFARQTVTQYAPMTNLNENMIKAMTWYDGLAAYGMKYLADPNSPYSKVSAEQVDYVQFPRETLRVKSGDCDDLSVLLSAGLESLGIETAMVDVPGHLFLMFNTRMAEKHRDSISLHDDLLVMRDQEVWIPLEATMIATSFSEAWAEGAKKYRAAERAKTLTVLPLKDAWARNLPVTLAPANYALEIAAADKLTPLIDRERRILVAKGLDRLVLPYRSLVKQNPANLSARLQIAIIYAQHGLYDQALKEFDQLLAMAPNNSDAHNNRGNIYYTLGDYDRALDAYRYAEELDPADGGIKMNLALTHYRRGRLQEAAEKYSEAVGVNRRLATEYQEFGKLLKN